MSECLADHDKDEGCWFFLITGVVISSRHPVQLEAEGSMNVDKKQ